MQRPRPRGGQVDGWAPAAPRAVELPRWPAARPVRAAPARCCSAVVRAASRRSCVSRSRWACCLARCADERAPRPRPSAPLPSVRPRYRRASHWSRAQGCQGVQSTGAASVRAWARVRAADSHRTGQAPLSPLPQRSDRGGNAMTSPIVHWTAFDDGEPACGAKLPEPPSRRPFSWPDHYPRVTPSARAATCELCRKIARTNPNTHSGPPVQAVPPISAQGPAPLAAIFPDPPGNLPRKP